MNFYVEQYARPQIISYDIHCSEIDKLLESIRNFYSDIFKKLMK
jgi:hypothetical protein